MCDQVMKCSADEVQINSSTSNPIATPESQGLTPTTDSELTMTLVGSLPGKVDPPHHVGKVEVSGDSLQSPQLLGWLGDS